MNTRIFCKIKPHKQANNIRESVASTATTTIATTTTTGTTSAATTAIVQSEHANVQAIER